MFLVFFKSIRVNEHIVKVCGAKLIEVGSKNIIDEVLKYCQGTGKTKWYKQRFEKAISGMEGSFPFLPFCYSDEIIDPLMSSFINQFALDSFRRVSCMRGSG
jgi:hypothetical protein